MIDLRASPLQQAVDRSGCGVEGLRNFRCLPLQNVAQDENRTLARGQVLQSGNKREPDRIAIDDDHYGGIIDVAQRRIRDRFQPGNLVALDQIVGRVRTRCAEAGREWTPRSPLQRGQAGIRRDAVEPGPERRLAFVAVEPAPSPDNVSWTWSSAS